MLKFLDAIDASKALRLNIPTFTNLAAFPSASSTYLGSIGYNDENDTIYYCNGSAWVQISGASGAMTFKGGVAYDGTEPSSPATGDTYVFTTAGTNTWEGSTVVEVGDLAIWNGTAWIFVQKNIGAASESAPGYVELATSAEAITGTDSTRAVHPAGLLAAMNANKVVSVGGTPGNILTGDGTTTTFLVEHTGKSTPCVAIRESSGNNYVHLGIERVSSTEFNVIFAIAPASTPTYTISIS